MIGVFNKSWMSRFRDGVPVLKVGLMAVSIILLNVLLELPALAPGAINVYPTFFRTGLVGQVFAPWAIGRFLEGHPHHLLG
jgi:hypothetical protein